jgi:octaprenyl-diphosphate synthase
MDKPFILIEKELREVEFEIRRNINSEVNLIPEIGSHIFFSGGKRFRPALLILCSKLVGNNSKNCIPIAGVIELIHTATLLHDDVVDRAELRRGVESANTIWGNQASILVGDFLLSQAFSIMIKEGDLRILEILAQTTKKMTEGEMFQLSLENSIDVTEQDYMSLIYSKTAVLISSTCLIGALMGGAKKTEEERLVKFGDKLGMAFQLVDDILDYTSNPKKIGKPIGNDLEEQKATLPLLYSLKKMNAKDRKAIENIFYADSKSEEDFHYVTRLIKEHGGLEYTLKRAREFSEDAKKYLEDFPDSDEKEALFDIADYVIERGA